MSDRQLEGQLLPDYFQFAHHSDSAYVRNFYSSALDFPAFTPLSHDLENDTEDLEKKLKVKFIVFEQFDAREQANERHFDLVYHTWMERGDWLTLSHFFKIKQIEEIIIDKKKSYRREVVYQWCLFFWIKSFE